MRTCKIFLIALAIPFFFACSSEEKTEDENPTFCECANENKKDAPDEAMVKKCDELYKLSPDATEEEIEEYMDKLSKCN